MRGIEPPYQPWQGCVLPLNYICIWQEIYYHIFLLLASTFSFFLRWRSRWDSNPRSPPWQGGMLTTTPLDHNFPKIRWRRRRDLNSRASFPTYTLSRGTSSATWVLLQEYFQNTYFLEQPALSVTPVYNNMDKNLLQANFLKKIKKAHQII